MSMKKLSTFAMVLSSLFSPFVMGAETDQFYVGSAVIRDSSLEMNSFFHEKIELALSIVNEEKNPVNCRLAAKEVLQQVVGDVNLIEWGKNKSFSKISVFTQTSPLIDRFPLDNISEKEFRAYSIYKNRPFPVNIVGVARTLNINGIYIGTDKLGHFSIVGKTYYKNFLNGLDEGLNPEAAQAEAIKKGLKQEIALLGYAVGGTFAYGDLEANYQGLQFGRNMCEGANPYLKLVNGKWMQNPENIFDIRKYVTPKFDEAYNVSFWSPRMWKKMKTDIVSAYCRNKIDPGYRARVVDYSKRDASSINDKLLEEFLKEKPKFNRSNQLLSKNIECN